MKVGSGDSEVYDKSTVDVRRAPYNFLAVSEDIVALAGVYLVANEINEGCYADMRGR